MSASAPRGGSSGRRSSRRFRGNAETSLARRRGADTSAHAGLMVVVQGRKMAACNAGTTLARALDGRYARCAGEVCALIREAFTTCGDMIPGEITVPRVRRCRRRAAVEFWRAPAVPAVRACSPASSASAWPAAVPRPAVVPASWLAGRPVLRRLGRGGPAGRAGHHGADVEAPAHRRGRAGRGQPGRRGLVRCGHQQRGGAVAGAVGR
jgi:hypothetical protein